MAVPDIREGNAEPLGDDLRKYCGVALAGILDIERQEQLVAAGKAQLRALDRRAAGMFEHAGNAKPAVFAALCRLALALLERVVVRKLERLVEDRREIAGIDGGA